MDVGELLSFQVLFDISSRVRVIYDMHNIVGKCILYALSICER